MKSVLAVFVLSVALAGCVSQPELDAANQRAVYAEQAAAAQAQRADEANARANEYWLMAKWNAATQPERLGVFVMGVAALGLFGLLGYMAVMAVMDAPGRRQHELDLRLARIREQEVANERAQLILIARQQQQQQLQAGIQVHRPAAIKKYAAPQLPPKS